MDQPPADARLIDLDANRAAVDAEPRDAVIEHRGARQELGEPGPVRRRDQRRRDVEAEAPAAGDKDEDGVLAVAEARAPDLLRRPWDEAPPAQGQFLWLRAATF